MCTLKSQIKQDPIWKENALCLHLASVSPGDKDLRSLKQPKKSKGQKAWHPATRPSQETADWDGAQRLQGCGFWQPPAPTACCAALTLSSQGSFPNAPWWLAEISRKARNRVCVCTWEAGLGRVGREFASAVIFSLSDKTEKLRTFLKGDRIILPVKS